MQNVRAFMMLVEPSTRCHPKTLVTLNVMVFGHVKCRQGWKALELFWQIQMEISVQPNFVIYARMPNASASQIDLKRAGVFITRWLKMVWSQIVGSSLADMNAKCRSIEDAWRVFHKLPSRHVVVTRTATVLGHVNMGKGRSNVL
jgi:hypothetical protein